MTVGNSRRCTYQYEPSPDSATPTEAVDVARPELERCPHAAADASNQRCLFHHPDSEFPVSRLTEQFLDVLSEPDVPPSFAGGQLSGLQLEGETLSTPDGRPIDLRGATIDGDLDLTNATVEVPLLLDGAAITGSLIATGATIAAPLSLVDTDVGRRTFLQKATMEKGVAANGLTAGYLDAREMTVNGSADFTAGGCSANAILARMAIEGDLTLRETSFAHQLDLTGITVGGTLDLSEAGCEGTLDIVASQVGHLCGEGMRVKGAIDCRHTLVEGDLEFTGAQFEAEAEFDDVSVEHGSANFSRCQFEARADFSTALIGGAEANFAAAQFEGEAWFTYAIIANRASFDRAEFHGEAHLRDVAFKGDLSLREATTTDQAFLHNSTIGGDFSAAGAQFHHFQFSATVDGHADFETTHFDEQALFMRSTFNGSTTFEGASFAGNPDFSDTRFTGETSFDGTEFLVEPTFDGTRFAVEPDFEAAQYPTPASRNLDDARQSMILARPETLRHAGTTIESSALTDDIVIPAKTSGLIEDDVGLTRAVTAALAEIEFKQWYQLFDDGLRTARTAVAQLTAPDSVTLVFGLSIDPSADDATEFIEDAGIAGVYGQQSEGVEFGHLETTLEPFDYLVPVPGDDDAFESGPSVAILRELATAMIRFQRFRTALLERREDADTNINTAVLPVLVAAARVGNHGVSESI